MTEDTQIQQELAVRDQLIAEVKPIKTDEDRQQANEMRVQVKGWLDSFTRHEKRVCDPQYQAWKNSKRWFAEQRKPVEELDSALMRELKADRQRQQEAQRKEQERQNRLSQKRHDRAQASGKGTPVPTPVAPIVQDTGKREEVEGGKVVWIDNYVPHVVDEAQIPREYLMPDMQKLRAAAKAGIEVPGVQRVNEQTQRILR